MQLAVLGGSSLLSGGGLSRVAILGASVAGSLLLNGRKEAVGKLNDVRVSSSSYGRGIAKIWGTIRTTGNMFWATDFKEEKFYLTQKGKEKTGAKGQAKAKKGKATPMYRYYANFAMGMCEGPVDDVLRVWADNNLIFNKLNSEDEDVVGPGFSTEEEDDTGKDTQRSKGAKKGSGGEGGSFTFRFYKGTETQKPDPFMESLEGNNNVPGYRDLCYLMFEELALADFGNRIPTITAEISKRSRQRPMVLPFENLEPPAIGWKNNFQFTNPFILDVKNERIFIGAVDNNDKNYIRIYNMRTRKEIKRLVLSDMSMGIPWYTMDHAAESPSPIWGVLSLPPSEMHRLQVQGVTLEGWLICYLMRGNYGITIFLTADGKPVTAFGVEGNWLVPGQMGIFAQSGGFAAVGQTSDGVPASLAIVTEHFRMFHVFELCGLPDGPGGAAAVYTKSYDRHPPESMDQWFLGAPGTDRALLGLNNTGTKLQIWNFPLDAMETPLARHEEDIEIGLTPLTTWPAGAGFDDSFGGTLVVHYVSYIIGAECIGLIAGNAGASPYVVKLDGITGKEVWRKKIPYFNPFNIAGWTNPKPYNNTNVLHFYANNYLVKIDFANETVEYDSSPAGKQYPNNNFPRHVWSEKDALVQIGNVGDTEELCPVIVYNDRKVQTGVSLGQIVRDVADDVGIMADQIDTAALSTDEELLGWMMEQPSEARQVIQDLANTYMFDCVESDFKLKFIPRGQPSVLTIPSSLLGEVESDFDTAGDKVIETFSHILELPQRVTLTFFNAKKDYESGTQYAIRPSKPVPVMFTKEHLEITLPAALKPINAKRIARRILYSAWAERHTIEFKLARDFIYLDPADVVTVLLDDGRALETRLTDMKMGSNYEMEMTGTANYADGYSLGEDDEVDPSQGVVVQPGNGAINARPIIYSIPYLTDDHENPRTSASYYWGAQAVESGFNYGVLQSRADGTGWMTEGYTTLDVLWGNIEGAVPPPANGWNIEDTTTEIILTPGFDWNDPTTVYEWESITEEDWPSEKNMIIIGDEIILFKNVVDNGDGTITISRLIRGYRGSIDAAYRHVTTDIFSLVLQGSINLNTEELNYLNASQYFAIISNPSLMIGNTTPGRITATPERPLPVGDVRRTNPGSDIQIDWSRSTRIGGQLKPITGTVPLGEDIEQYHVFLIANPYNASIWYPTDDTKYLWKSAPLSSPTATITAATLTAHGLSNTMDIHVVIHQMSASVDYGLPHGLTLPYTKIGV